MQFSRLPCLFQRLDSRVMYRPCILVDVVWFVDAILVVGSHLDRRASVCKCWYAVGNVDVNVYWYAAGRFSAAPARVHCGREES